MTREIALHCMKSYSELHSDLCELCPIYGETGSDHCFEDALQYVIGMLERDLSSELDKNSKKLEKNFGESDCISREQAKEAIRDKFKDLSSRVEINTILNDLPSVTPQEPILDKIRAEIKQYQSDYDVHGTEYDRTAWKAFNRCLQSIDKYKAETER